MSAARIVNLLERIASRGRDVAIQRYARASRELLRVQEQSRLAREELDRLAEARRSRNHSIETICGLSAVSAAHAHRLGTLSEELRGIAGALDAEACRQRDEVATRREELRLADTDLQRLGSLRNEFARRARRQMQRGREARELAETRIGFRVQEENDEG